MKKRIAAIFLALAMITAYMPALAFAEVAEGETNEVFVEESSEKVTEEVAENEASSEEKIEEVVEDAAPIDETIDVGVEKQNKSVEILYGQGIKESTLLDELVKGKTDKTRAVLYIGGDEKVVDPYFHGDKTLYLDDGTYYYEVQKALPHSKGWHTIKNGFVTVSHYATVNLKVVPKHAADVVIMQNAKIVKDGKVVVGNGARLRIRVDAKYADVYAGGKKLKVKETVTGGCIATLDEAELKAAVDEKTGELNIFVRVYEVKSNLNIKNKTVVISEGQDPEAAIEKYAGLKVYRTIDGKWDGKSYTPKADEIVVVANDLHVGANEVIVHFTGNDKYDACEEAMTVFVKPVKKLKTWVGFEGGSKYTYGDEQTSPEITINSFFERPIEDADYSVVYKGLNCLYYSHKAPTEAGTYEVSVVYGGDKYHEPCVDKKVFTIERKEIAIVADYKEVEYGNALPKLTWSLADGSEVDETFHKSLVGVELYISTPCKGWVGEYEITGYVKYNFNRNFRIGKLINGINKVTPKPIECTWKLDNEDKKTVVYDEKEHTASVTADGICWFDEQWYDVKAEAQGDVTKTEAGEYKATATLTYKEETNLQRKTAGVLVSGGIARSDDAYPFLIRDNKTDIIKDASSTAIYGSQAANGVVMITSNNTMSGSRGSNGVIIITSALGVSGETAETPVDNYVLSNSDFDWTITEKPVEPKEDVETGDTNNMLPFAIVGVVALAGIVALLVVRRRRTN